MGGREAGREGPGFEQHGLPAGTLCTCSNRVKSCPEPDIVGTTQGFKVDLPMLGVRSEAKAFLAKYPNYAYKVSPPPSTL